ncbi:MULTISPECIES: NAD-dependent succinate-semialdehyde dehydrogenase [Bacillus]|uniref:NAD-dependent succinate-semialdehyde dehydrogenase n=1 Tax=Bacillus TaxID=1386 RepID=UPI0006885C26|nr:MULTISPECIES: NAD-dependent succinate-semialdehyde dehydrogenase [Bacillus]
MLINGERVFANGEISVINPATNEKIASVPNGGEKEATAAVDAASEALAVWSKKTANERAQILKKWFALIEEHKEELAETMTKEQGKPYSEALGEINYANSFVEWYAEEGKRIYGDTIPASDPSKRIIVIKQPVGVIAAITPWNFPAAMITRKIAPALAAGCTTIIKPAKQTPLTAIRLVELAYEAGIDRGAINLVTGNAQEISEAWMKDERVRKVSFTGSTEIGKQLMKNSADTMKKISLELGGHAPFIVMEDANIDMAVESVIQSKFRNAGQTCICTNRVFVQESIYDKFVEKMIPAVLTLKVGNGLNPDVAIGPLIDEAAVKKVKEHIEDAVQKGAEILTETAGATNQLFMDPVVIGKVNDEMLCMREETFGPLAPITTFQTVDEAIKRANHTPYGLAAYVFTQNISTAVKIAEALEYGIVGLNDALPSVAQAPFGGMKESGIGREGGKYGIEEYLETKYISLKL